MGFKGQYGGYEDLGGIGPGAHGGRGGFATGRHRKPENFLKAVNAQHHGIAEVRELGIREQAAEALLMGLRLDEGIAPAALAKRFGLAETDLIDPAKRAFYASQGLLTTQGDRLIVTQQGMPLLDGLLGELVPAALVSA